MSMTEEQKKLLAYAGNLSQLAGIRESVITGGRGGGMRIAEVWNAAGLRFTTGAAIFTVFRTGEPTCHMSQRTV